jgi:luciferase family oxidoreductase group 1
VPLPVSILDLVGMRPAEPAGTAIARSVDLAQHAEQWGYRRFWLAEHHSISGLACSATPVLIGHVASATKSIRVGSGGIMLPNHAPLVVAEQFGTLAALYPDRIDLGLGRAPGGDFLTMRALRRDLRQTGDDFPALLEELQAYLGPERPGQIVKAIPGQTAISPSRCSAPATSARSSRPVWACPSPSLHISRPTCSIRRPSSTAATSAQAQTHRVRLSCSLGSWWPCRS